MYITAGNKGSGLKCYNLSQLLLLYAGKKKVSKQVGYSISELPLSSL